MALAGTQQLRSQGPVSVNAHCTEGVTGPEGREGANGVGGENGDGNGGGGGNGDGGEDERVNARWEGGREGGRKRGQ